MAPIGLSGMVPSHRIASGALAEVEPSWCYHLSPVFAIVFLAVLLSGKLKPSSCNISFAITISLWFWSIIVWASDVEILEQRLLSRSLPMSRAFWLTFIPQMVCAVVAMVVAPKQFFSLGCSSGGSSNSGAWYAAGLGLFFGQLLTNAALSAASPVVTFVIRAIEPIAIAQLAMFALDKTTTLQQLVPIFVSCSGVILSVIGCHKDEPSDLNISDAAQDDQDLSGIKVACLLAMASNLGYAVRSCSVKFAYTMGCQQQICPKEVFVNLAKTAFAASLIPLVLFLVDPSSDVSRLSHLTSALRDCWLPMLSMSLSCTVQWAASLMVLNAIAVESHSLTNSIQKVILAVLTTMLMGETLARLTLIGLLITVVGISTYATAPIQLEQSHPQDSNPSEADQLLPASHKQGKGGISCGLALPNSLVICSTMVALAGVQCSFGEVGSFRAPN
jgi:drug/metabolite transporter (DMT)-like permease